MSYYGSRMVMYHGAHGGTVFSVGTAIALGGLIPEIDSESMEGEILDILCGEVEFKDLKFAYPLRPGTIIFKDFNLKIIAGKAVALVGESGSGKSTVIALLQRFYDPIEGEIMVDGVAIEKLQLKWLRSQMGLVSQEPALFSTTIKENILFGKEDGSMEELIEAAKAANAHNFTSQLPQGYDTQVGERGVKLSGGQKQRIAIARAIIKAPRILLLDEATSALDSKSEVVVQEALDKASIGRTTIIIAHRLSTIRNADLIVVVKDGEIKETGSHHDLIQDPNSLYSTLANLQHSQKYSVPLSGSTKCTNSNIASISNIDINNSSTQRLSMISQSSSAHSREVGRVKVDHRDPGEQILPVPSFKRLLARNIPEWRQAVLGSSGAVLLGDVQPVYDFSKGSMISAFFLPDHDEMEGKIRIYVLCFVGLAVFSFFVNVIQHYNFAAGQFYR
ncbi:ABC transporter domain-containing protein [Heracleum sosnowskyi]|uniref:ABC transporter domain-containing protein n=1 Tax=Heracleum sosnowskyi TaxID=360622 RepID=A0AAD8MNW7_9APIA|nr:ABC transporter domain-containing protein [Heracleum sosnowskyi]